MTEYAVCSAVKIPVHNWNSKHFITLIAQKCGIQNFTIPVEILGDVREWWTKIKS